MQKLLIVIDMQNDFIDGTLGSPEAQGIVPHVLQRVSTFAGTVLFTQDTHAANYLETQEGKNLPVPHCIRGSKGWELQSELEKMRKTSPLLKTTFGSKDLGPLLLRLNEEDPIEEITFLGLCTDICVISNVLIAKAFLPEVPIRVDARGCAGITPKSHAEALSVMKQNQIQIDE